MKRIFIGLLIITISYSSLTFALEKAPRISDREILERLIRLEEGQKNLEKRIDDINKRIDALEASLNKRIDDTNKRIDDTNKRIDALEASLNKRIDDVRSEINSRFDTMQWMLGLFITIALVILGFVLRMQWQMHKRQTKIEAVLETQRDELAFIRRLVEKLLPPKAAL